MSIRTFFKKLLYSHRLRKSGLSFPLYCKIHGVKNAEKQGGLAQTRAGDNLQVVHVPIENYPFNAYVYSIPLNRTLGYLDEGLSKRLVYLFGKGFCRDAVVENITGGAEKGMKYFGCNIRILQTMTMMQDCEDFSALRG